MLAKIYLIFFYFIWVNKIIIQLEHIKMHTNSILVLLVVI